MFDKLTKATNNAFGTVSKSLCIEQDQDLNLYRSLKAEHFPVLVQKYGMDEVIDYVTTMESKNVRRE